MNKDPFGARDTFDTGNGSAYYYRLGRMEELGHGAISRLPFSIKILLEGALRGLDGRLITEKDVETLAKYDPSGPEQTEIPYNPGRVLLQDFTGVPAVVDLAALRSAMARQGGDPEEINPRVPVDLVIDHCGAGRFVRAAAGVPDQRRDRVQAQPRAVRVPPLGRRRVRELQRRPAGAWDLPPGQPGVPREGVMTTMTDEGLPLAYPDTLVGTDSHTTMINGLGVLGWGVGGIEAEAAMLGQPIFMLMPEVIGFKLTGRLKEGVTATDLTLTVTQMLRKHGVVGKFVEFFGTGLSAMTLPDRATIANMAPEYGATMGFFPVDEETLNYMRRTNRSEDLVQLVERYTKAQGLFRTDETPDPQFRDTLELDLGDVEPSALRAEAAAGPAHARPDAAAVPRGAQASGQPARLRAERGAHRQDGSL